MKYAHVIYNSSEKSKTGSVGFGVRCTTEGTPVELTSAMEENDIFSFAEAGPSLSPSALAANPDSIRQIVPTYFFRSVPLPDKSRAFVLGRKIAVGFDYTFYLNGKPGRLGNYVVDSYVFPQPPTAKEFEILLEDAESGSNHFIPSSPVPTPDNREMIEISLGHKPDLPVEERPFTSRTMLKVSPQAIELLFSFIQSRKEEKPVLVKSDIATPPRLMAELAMLIPENQIENLTFITNHTDEGKKKGINIVFINEYYTFEIFKKQWVWLDLEANAQCESAEATLFRETVKKYVEQGDFEAIHKLVGWCLSSMYEKGKSFPRETQTQLYNYVYNYPEFRIKQIATDQNLRLTLNDYFLSNPEEKKKFDISLQEWFRSIQEHDLDELWQWIEYIIAVSPIDCKDTINVYKTTITHTVFETQESFAAFYNRFRNRFQEVLRFVDMAAFPEKDVYLSAMPADWERLYTLFLGDKVRNHEYLAGRMISDNIDPTMRQRIVAKEISQQEGYIKALTGILSKGAGRIESKVTKILFEELSKQNRVSPDFFELFPSKLDDGFYTSLYIWQLQNFHPRNPADVKKLADYLILFLKNDRATTWASETIGANVFTQLYAAVKESLKRKAMTRQEASAICVTMTGSPYPRKNVEPFEILNKVLRHADTHGESRVGSLWEVSKELGDKEYLTKITPSMLAYAEMVFAKKNPEQFYELCGYILDKGILSHERLIEVAKRSLFQNYYYCGILRYEDKKPQEQLDFLIKETGKSDEEALKFLEKAFPKSYEKILKSRQPSLMQKMSGMFKNMFGKKQAEKEVDSDKSTYSGKKTDSSNKETSKKIDSHSKK